MKKSIFFALSLVFLAACGGPAEPVSTEPAIIPLPYIGHHEVVNGDSVYHTIPSYTLIAQDSSLFNNERVKGKIHVANFFFTSCPSICPAMIGQMQRLQTNTADIEELVFLSHTIDPERDTIPKLQQFIADRSIDTHNWFFLWGDREYVHDLGMEGYMVNANEDAAAEGGFLHSEHFILIDREGHIRGLYVGTETEEVDQLEKDIRKLLREEYAN